MAVVISEELVLSDPTFVEKANNARIAYHTYTRTAAVSASSAADGFPASAVKNPLTYEFWKPTTLPAAIAFDCGEAVDADYFFIAAHTLVGKTITAQYSSNGADWSNCATSVLVYNNAPIMILFDSKIARYYRLYIEGEGDTPLISVIYIGRILTMQRGIYGGHAPITLNRVTVTAPNVSERGQWLGRSIIRAGYSAQFNWKNLNADWYREFFDPFVESARKYPFGIAWRPQQYPDEVAYVWVTEDIRPSNMGIKDFMQVGFKAEGIAE